MKRLLIAVLLLVALSFPAYNAFQNKSHPSTARAEDRDALLLEHGKGASVKTSETPPSEIKVVSYNIRWRSGDDLKRLIKLLRDDPEIGSASIIGLQEVDRKKKRTGNSNVAKQMADDLGMHYVWAAPPTTKPDDEEETGVAILSAYPLSDVRRIVLPHQGPNGRRRAAVGATVEMENQKWRVYSAHAETRLSLDKKIEQYQSILQDLAKYPSGMPAIVLGDLNTWEADAERKTIKLFSEAGLRTPFRNQNTFRRRILLVPIEFRLDWVWLRGLEASSYGIDRKIDVSDHWPLWTRVKPLPASGKTSTAKQ
jgi:endonuclease/exonuclease/phosphatase family metal-dependent hydrolase